MDFNILNKALDNFIRLAFDQSHMKWIDRLVSHDFMGLYSESDYNQWYFNNENVLKRLTPMLSYSGEMWADAKNNKIYIFYGSPKDEEFAAISKTPLKEENLKRLFTIEKDPDNDIKVIDQILVRGYKTIPDLYISIITNTKDTSVLDIPKEHMFFGYLFPAFQYWDLDINDFNKFLEENKDKLYTISRNFEYYPKLLGHGADGFVFDVGEKFVLKIFKQKYTYEKAIEGMGYLYERPDIGKTELMIYDAGTLKLKDKEIYYYLIQKVKPIDKIFSLEELKHFDKLIVAIADYYMSNLYGLYIDGVLDISEENSIKIIKRHAKKLAQNIKKGLRDKMGDRIEDLSIQTLNNKFSKPLDLNNSWLENFIEEMFVKQLSGRKDFSPLNIGVTNTGDLRFFDSAFPVGVVK